HLRLAPKAWAAERDRAADRFVQGRGRPRVPAHPAHNERGNRDRTGGRHRLPPGRRPLAARGLKSLPQGSCRLQAFGDCCFGPSSAHLMVGDAAPTGGAMTQANSRTADHPIDPLFLERWSPRAFTDAPICERDLLTLLEAARWAPSSFNSQPWRFLYARRHTQ